jgi:hypothetical protein
MYEAAVPLHPGVVLAPNVEGINLDGSSKEEEKGFSGCKL